MTLPPPITQFGNWSHWPIFWAFRQWPALCLYTVIDSAVSLWHSIVLPSLTAKSLLLFHLYIYVPHLCKINLYQRLSLNGNCWLMEVYFMNEELNSCVSRNDWVTWLYKSDFLVNSNKKFFCIAFNFSLEDRCIWLGRTLVTHCISGFTVH